MIEKIMDNWTDWFGKFLIPFLLAILMSIIGWTFSTTLKRVEKSVDRNTTLLQEVLTKQSSIDTKVDRNIRDIEKLDKK